VVHHYANLASILGKAHLPFRSGQRRRKSSEGCGSGLEAGGKGFRSVTHIFSFCLEIEL
jgi:hypothetical protein